MAETMVTPDGKLHVLLDNASFEAVIREYAGYDAAMRLHALLGRDTYDTARTNTDLGAYEASLERWQRMAQEWAEEIYIELRAARTKQQLIAFLQRLYRAISNNL